jgi:hypothetical protein
MAMKMGTPIIKKNSNPPKSKMVISSTLIDAAFSANVTVVIFAGN